jgi:hypothetical protein
MLARRRAPPQVAALDSPPFEVRGHRHDERLDIATDRSVQDVLYALDIGLGHFESTLLAAARLMLLAVSADPFGATGAGASAGAPRSGVAAWPDVVSDLRDSRARKGAEA